MDSELSSGTSRKAFSPQQDTLAGEWHIPTPPTHRNLVCVHNWKIRIKNIVNCKVEFAKRKLDFVFYAKKCTFSRKM